MRTSLSVAIGLAALVAAPAAAFAQDTSVGGSVNTTTETTTLPAPAAPVTQPAAATTTTTTTTKVQEHDDGVSDHEKYAVGHLAFGYMGISTIPISDGSQGNGVSTINAPVIGVRYWFNERVGLDVGIGLGWSGGSQETTTANATVSVDQAARFGLGLHGGVPLALASYKHFKFLVVPELNVAFAASKIASNDVAVSDTSLSGFQLDLGGRVGGEIHFGFIGVPQLSLQATVGAALRYQSWGRSQDNPSTSASTSQWSLGTTVQSDPWALFTNNISALYYFP